MALSPYLSAPNYHGGCGRLAVFTHGGKSLASFIHSSWNIRVKLALQLLQISMNLSSNSIGLAIYPTDWAAHNWAVDYNGTIKLVDLENIILVNVTNMQGRTVQHISDNYGCPDNECFSYSVPQLCSHETTDHNFHGVCGSLLAPSPYSINLLHTIPHEVLKRHPSLPSDLVACWRGGKYGSRRNAVLRLTNILADNG